MKANEAKLKSEISNSDKSLKEYNEVIQAINSRCDIGMFSLNYYKTISGEVFNKLLEDGYKIDQGVDGRNESYCYINW